MTVSNGCDRLLDQPEVLAGKRYGLLAHSPSVTADHRHLHLSLKASAAGPPTAIFGPEHGYYAVEQDMIASCGEQDPLTGIPIVSLYGDSVDSLRPDPQAFAGLDLLLIDLQDVGARYYTYAATAVWAAEVAIAAGVEVWVLDRPNPLGGDVIEGDLLRPGYTSFVGAFHTPVRHGLTLGELMQLEANRRGWDSAGLKIWTMEGWQRTMTWAETGLTWFAPSPNMPTVDTAFIYPGGCLIEATSVSEGRGTTRPFQLVGAPGIDALALARTLEGRELPGVVFLPTYFRPQFQKHAGRVCAGVQVEVTNPQRFQAYRCGLELLVTLHNQFPESFGWRQAPYEFVGDQPAIDLLTGGPEVRQALERREDLSDWIDSWRASEQAFRDERQDFLLYS